MFHNINIYHFYSPIFAGGTLHFFSINQTAVHLRKIRKKGRLMNILVNQTKHIFAF